MQSSILDQVEQAHLSLYIQIHSSIEIASLITYNSLFIMTDVNDSPESVSSNATADAIDNKNECTWVKPTCELQMTLFGGWIPRR